MLGVYIYAVGPQSCATRLIFAGSAPLIDIAFGDSASLRGIPAGGGEASRAWHLWSSSARCSGSRPHTPLATASGGSAFGPPPAARPSASGDTPLPAPPLPSSSRRYAPQCFVGGYVSSPCDVSHRASDEPRRCMSLSSALAPSSLASPSTRRVFLRSICARRHLSARLAVGDRPRGTVVKAMFARCCWLAHIARIMRSSSRW